MRSYTEVLHRVHGRQQSPRRTTLRTMRQRRRPRTRELGCGAEPGDSGLGSSVEDDEGNSGIYHRVQVGHSRPVTHPFYPSSVGVTGSSEGRVDDRAEVGGDDRDFGVPVTGVTGISVVITDLTTSGTLRRTTGRTPGVLVGPRGDLGCVVRTGTFYSCYTMTTVTDSAPTPIDSVSYSVTNGLPWTPEMTPERGPPR